MTRLRPTFLALAVLVSSAGPTAAQTTYTWNDSTTEWVVPGAWTPDGPNWAESARLTDSFAAFGNQATIFNQPTIGFDSVFVRGVTVNNSGAAWSIAGNTGVLSLGSGGLTVTGAGTKTTSVTANLRVAADQAWTVGPGMTVVMGGGSDAGVLSGYGTVTKAGAGTLVVDNTQNTFTGAVVISGGTVQLGSAVNNGSANAVRNAAIDFGAGTGSLTTAGSVGRRDLRAGQFGGTAAGASVATGSGGVIHLLVLEDASFAGSVTADGLNVRGSATQTFTGNLTGLTGTAGINRGAGLSLAGAGDSTSGVIGATTVALRGGTLTLDNSGGNTAAPGGRVSDAATITSLGGRLSLVGSAAGTSETVGALNLTAGATTVSVTHTAPSAATVLTAAGLGRVAGTGTIDFAGTGGTLGAAGDNPRVVFTAAPALTNGVISQAAGSAVLGFATVDGRNFAGYDPANGVVAIAPTAFGGSGSSVNALLTSSGTTGGSASAFSLNTLTIDPSGANQTLDISGAGNLNVAAFLYRGDRTDFRITSSGGGAVTGGATRVFHVTDPAGMLRVDAALGTNFGVIKAGAGTLFLNGSTASITGATTINEGALRVAVSDLPAGQLNLRGGVLEIAGGGTFTRTLGVGAGRVNWDTGSSDRGDGGFAAFGGPATVSIGGTLVWDAPNFVRNGHALRFGSPLADGTVTWTADVGLDGGNPGDYWAREVHVAAGAAGGRAVMSGIVSGSVASDLLKTGAGTLELSGANTYRGNTLVRAGTLIAGGSIGMPTNETGNVVVGPGAALGGPGRVLQEAGGAGTVRVRSGGEISAGIGPGTVARLTLVVGAGGLVLEDDATYRVKLFGTGPADISLLDVTGDVLVGGGAKLALDLSGLSAAEAAAVRTGGPRTYTVVNNIQDGVGTGVVGNFSAANFGVSDLGNFAPGEWALVAAPAAGTVQLQFAPVPEPAAVLAVAAGALALGGLVRRRRGKAEPAAAA